MAKKQLKKINQPKKYLQGGSNMASVAQTRQNPYYIGQVNADAAEDQFKSSQDQLAQTRVAAVQAQKESEAQQKAALDQSLQQGVGTLGKAAMADKKAGRLGKFFTKEPMTGVAGMNAMTEVGANAVNTTSAAFAPIAASAAPTAATIGQAGQLVNPIMTSAGGNAATQMVVGQAAPTMSVVGGAPITGAANVASTGTGAAGTAATGLSSLASAGIGIAANVGGQIIKKRANDNSAYTFTDKERRGNVGGSALSSAGTAAGIALNPAVLGATGGLSLLAIPLAAGIGALKARKENKASQEEADRLQREQAAIRGSYQSAFVNSRLTGADTGFGLNSSTNMNNQFTNQYQVARTGGVKKVPGGQIVPIEGTDAVEFKGRSHENGGVTIDKNTEVEGGETMDQVAMNNNNKQDYIFSKYLKLGGKSFAQRHKEILKGSGSQADIQQLAAMQEKVAGRNPQQVAAYGGFHKYIDGGVKPCPECPPGTICDVATGACVSDEDSGSNSYDWNATGVEGFKAKQNAAAPAATAGKQVSQADYDFFIREKNARLADEQNKIAAQNGTSNAPADATASNTDNSPKNKGRKGEYVFKTAPTLLPIEPTKTFSQQKLEEGMAKQEAYETEGLEAFKDNFGRSYINPEYHDLRKVTLPDGSDAFTAQKYDPNMGNMNTSWAQRRYNNPDGTIGFVDIMDPKMGDHMSTHVTVDENGNPTFEKVPETAERRDQERLRKNAAEMGVKLDFTGNIISIPDDVSAGQVQKLKEMGYKIPDSFKQGTSQITDLPSLETAYYDTHKITYEEYEAKKAELEAANAAPTAPTAPVNPGVQAPANTQPVAQTDNTVAPDGTKLPAGYVWDATLNAPVSATADAAATNASANKAGTATYTPAPGVTPPAATTNTGTPTPPPATVTNTNPPPAAANTGTNTGPTVSYTNSTNPTAPGVTQTPEEIEAARLANKPRYFMGANRKVDEATGNVTVDQGKPLMGVGAMAGSRLGTTTGSQEALGKVTNNSYDQAWTNKADNLYTNQKDASGGGLSSSDAIADRDKIAGSNWGQKYGYKVGMTADEAKAAHGKFAEDVHSLFASNPDEMLGYFQYIVDGGDPSKTNSYLGKDAEQIRNNLKTKGYIDANGQPIAGKVVAGKTMSQYLEGQATNNAVGPIHNALGSYTAERGSDRIKLEKEKEKEKEKTKIPDKFEPCPPGTYRSGDGTCKEVGDVPQKNRISGTMLAGLGQLIPVGAALANPYKIAPGIVGAPGIKGSLMPRMNLNQERASAIQQNVAYKNAVVNQNAGPAALVAMQSANTKTNDQMLKIAQQEQDSNRQLAAEEGKLGMQASMFNAETDQKRQMFNTEFNQKERQYRREDLLGALDTGAARIAGIVKDDRAFKAQERLATALDETGSYDRYTILEQLNKESKRKNSPYYGTTEAERRRMAAAMHKELNPEGYVAKSEYNKLQEEKDKLKKEKEEAAKQGQAKFGGARQYVSRLGQLSGVRATKAKL
jgi:hypothetical protein